MPSGADDPASSRRPRNGCTSPALAGPVCRDRRCGRCFVPSPGVAEPKSGQHVQLVGVKPCVGYLDVREQGLRVRLGVGHFDDPIAVAIESPRVQQFVLGIRPRPSPVLALEMLVRERDLRVVVPPAVPGVTWYRVQVPPVLLDIFAVVALLARKPERSSFRMGSRPFQTARLRQRRCSMSLKPARPSSPQRYTLDRAWSCGK